MPPDPAPDSLPHAAGSRGTPAEDVFEHYRIFRRDDGSLWELGHGSMGVTYKAIDTNLDKPVALKIISAQLLGRETSQRRFRREARAAASLHHRHIAGVYHLGESGGNFFYAMEYVDGDTVEQTVRRDGPLPWRAALNIALQITRALMAAHSKGLVHRDLKPANIMVSDEVDERGVAKLIDFGLAKSAAEENADGVTNASGLLGTPLYASPEQCEEIPADIRSDIYSLGVTLWFMLTGEPPFQGKLMQVFHQQLLAPPPVEKLPADLPAHARLLLERMLAKDRAQRPQTPGDLRTEIEACLSAPSDRRGAKVPLTVLVSQAPAARAAGTGCSRRVALLAWGIGGVAVVAVAVAVVRVRQGGVAVPEHPPDRAPVVNVSPTIEASPSPTSPPVAQAAAVPTEPSASSSAAPALAAASPTPTPTPQITIDGNRTSMTPSVLAVPDPDPGRSLFPRKSGRVALPYNLTWLDRQGRLASLFAGISAKVVARRMNGPYEVWTVEELVAPNLKRSFFTFQQGMLVGLEFDYGQTAWGRDKYQENMGRFCRLLEAKCESPGEVIDHRPEGLPARAQMLVGYRWKLGDTMVELFCLSAEDGSKPDEPRAINVCYHYRELKR